MFAGFASVVDNPFFPLLPGATYIYAGTDGEGGAMRIDVRVSEKTKLVDGVRCTVAVSNEYVDGELVERSLDYYAQDRAGNVWYFGEDSTEMDEDIVVSRAGSWLAGVDGAVRGLIMPSRPRVGQTYLQEAAPGVAEDTGRVVTRGERVRHLRADYRDVLVVADSTSLDADVLEYKYYARGIGLIAAVGVQDELERIELVEHNQIVVERPTALRSDLSAERDGSKLGRSSELSLFSGRAIVDDESPQRDDSEELLP